MKLKFKNILILTMMGAAPVFTACNNWLDLQPISQITPEGYYQTPDQVANYLNNYYTQLLIHPYNMGNTGYMFHDGGYNDGMNQLDNNTDIFIVGTGSTGYFGDTGQWRVGSGKALQDTYFSRIRICNYFFEQVNSRIKSGTYDEATEMPSINHYLGEMYVLRAITYYNALVQYGDFPIIETVLRDNQEEIVAASQRRPRNEVARFILSDLDKAIGLLQDRNGSLTFQGRRINKQVAQLLKSRVALFEATFEKYHQGSGRVPGDATWPGAEMSYNQGKTFDIPGEIDFFLKEAKAAAKEVAGFTSLTTNSHEINPPIGTIYGWNQYFEMFGQNDLSGINEVLMWREYSVGRGIRHRVGYRTMTGCNDGFTRQFVDSFLKKDGTPIYEDNTYDDSSLDNVVKDRDERLQLFMWTESTLLVSDPNPQKSPTGTKFFLPSILTSEQQIRSMTGYQSRKYFTYDSAQTVNDEGQGETAAPMFRSVEAMLNYMEADYEEDNSLDGNSTNYWNQIRSRAGFEAGSVQKSIDLTDFSKENDLGSYSKGEKLTDKTLYNIRRERMNELFGEGLRYADLIRWRSFDQMIGGKERFIPEGIHFWGTAFENAYLYKHDGKYYERQYEAKEIKDPDGTVIAIENQELGGENGAAIVIDIPKSEAENQDAVAVPLYRYTDEKTGEQVEVELREIKVNEENDAVLSKPEYEYLRPTGRTTQNNQLYTGYQWHEAYYLCPLGVNDMRYASPDTDVNTTYMYQNPFWPTEAGSALK